MNFNITPASIEELTSLRQELVCDGIIDLHVKFDFPKATRPKEVRVNWRFSMRELQSVWTPQGGYNRSPGIDWSKRRADSRQAVGAPVLACMANDGKNLLTVGVSDAKTPLSIRCGVSEEKADLVCYVAFFTADVAPISTYEATIRFDTRPLPFTDTVLDIGKWWESECGYPRAAVPSEAKMPMNSAWYTFHQQLDPNSLLHECRQSAEYGLKTIIIDDGWQTENNERGYAYCGDWELCRSKIPDMAELVRGIHDTGMKVIVWYGVPLVGKHSKAYEKFKDKALGNWGDDVILLDVRYPEAREHLIGVFAEALREWDIDGFKFDFVDCFRMYANTPDFCEGMDHSSIEDAVERLFADTTRVLGEIKEGLMYEFRQGYFGPSILKYGNMVRVADCPYNSLQNQTEIINLRLTSGSIPVHSDMLMWHRDDTVEAVSIQIIATLFGVPQISVKFDKISDEQKKALKFWMEFYTEHEALLHEGRFSVKDPVHSCTQVASMTNDESVTVNYAPLPFEALNKQKQIFINSTFTEENVLLLTKADSAFSARIQNCMGELVNSFIIRESTSALPITIPPCGLVTLEKLN